VIIVGHSYSGLHDKLVLSKLVSLCNGLVRATLKVWLKLVAKFHCLAIL
jgi:hypothetical protein